MGRIDALMVPSTASVSDGYVDAGKSTGTVTEMAVVVLPLIVSG